MENKPWLAQYPAGVPANIDITKYERLMDFVMECFEKYKKLPAYENFGKSITYKQLHKLSDQFAGYLISRGLKPGDKIALMMPNLLQYPVALFGALKAGLIVVNTNPLYTPREMEHQFKDSEVSAIVIAENFASNLEKIIDKLDINVIITTSIGEMLGSIKGGIMDFAIKNIKRAVPKYSLKNTVDFKTALETGKKFEIPPLDSSGDDVILHQYTGGTTGVAKGAMLTNKNMIANMLQMSNWLRPNITEKQEIALSPLPMYHIFAFSVNSLALMFFGAKTVLVTNPRDLSSVVKEFGRNKITVMTGINTLFNALNNNDDFQKADFSSLKTVVGGGMAVQQAVAERWEEITGVRLSEGYGMTEASPVVTANPLDKSARLGTIGVPIPSTDVRLVDDQGQVVAQGEIGEIQVKGPQVMRGYFKQPEETAKTIVDGWLNTGDLAIMMEDGYFKIIDRKKDMILVSGFNVYPNEIEDVLVKHPKISEVAAVAAQDPKSGEVVRVCIVKQDKSLTEKEVIEYCRENLTGYKVPKVVDFMKELPKSNVGKILRKELRDKA